MESVLLGLEAWWAKPRIWLGPAWAVLCGGLASGRLGFNGRTLLVLLLSLFLGDPLLGTIWREASIIASPSSPTSLSERSKARLSPPPYTLPGSLADRLFRWAEGRLSWWSSVWPRFEAPLAGLAFALPLAFVLAILLGRSVVMLIAVALILVAWESLRLNGGKEPSRLLRASYAGGMAWLVGYLAFGPSIPQVAIRRYGEAILWALIYTGVLYAFQSIDKGERDKGVRVLNLVQIFGVAVLVLTKEPILAGVAGLLLLPQMLLQPVFKRRDWYLQRTQFLAMMAMMVGALAVAI
ncbi:MAG: hypothetical protein ACE5LG_07785 [Anaerolineae bacterium]